MNWKNVQKSAVQGNFNVPVFVLSCNLFPFQRLTLSFPSASLENLPSVVLAITL